MPELRLEGCTPEPLMGYLKALGVLRLVSEQVDAEVRGAWQEGAFVLQTKLDRSALLDFFKDSYQPTPLPAPWGARSGFYAGSSEKSARAALEAIQRSALPRLQPFRTAIACTRRVLKHLGFKEKVSDEDKLRLMRACRAEFPDELLQWLDAVYVLTNDDRTFPPILGTGGNEGSGSYVSGYAQMVVSAIVEREWDHSLEESLFSVVQADSYSGQTPGHFSPEDLRGTNPWDYLLALEGCCLWASGLVRRAGLNTGRGVAAFPFTVQPVAAGESALCGKDGIRPKSAKRDIAEMWVPLWDKFILVSELELLLSEGRASNGKRAAKTAMDFALAASNLGVDRGIGSFQRFSFLMRNGQSFYAASLGRVAVTDRPTAYLVEAVTPWIDILRRASAGDAVPARFMSAVRRIDSAIFDFCKYGGGDRMAAILASLGAAERELALGDVPADKRRVRRPLAGLSADWITACDDDTSEYRLARGLAFLQGDPQKNGPIRRCLEPVKFEKRRWVWAERGGHVVWSGGNLSRNLGVVLARRLMDAESAGGALLPLDSRFPASLSDVAAFLRGQVDDQRLEDLLWGLMLVDPTDAEFSPSTLENDALLSSAYALLKLTLLPWQLNWGSYKDRVILRTAQPGEDGGITVKPEPGIVSRLRAGDVQGACEVAVRRLRASGLVPLATHRQDGSRRDIAWSGGDAFPERLLAALLFPIPEFKVNALADLVLRQPEIQSLA